MSSSSKTERGCLRLGWISVTGISAKRTPGTSTSSTPWSLASGTAAVSSAAGSPVTIFGADAGAAPLVAEAFRAGAFFATAGVLAAAAVFASGTSDAAAGTELAAAASDSVAVSSSCAMTGSTAGDTSAPGVRLRASGKNRSTGRDGADPLPDAAAELGMSAPSPRPRPRRLSLMDKSLHWKSRASPGSS